jgi:hypothetical protein
MTETKLGDRIKEAARLKSAQNRYTAFYQIALDYAHERVEEALRIAEEAANLKALARSKHMAELSKTSAERVIEILERSKQPWD